MLSAGQKKTIDPSEPFSFAHFNMRHLVKKFYRAFLKKETIRNYWYRGYTYIQDLFLNYLYTCRICDEELKICTRTFNYSVQILKEVLLYLQFFYLATLTYVIVVEFFHEYLLNEVSVSAF